MLLVHKRYKWSSFFLFIILSTLSLQGGSNPGNTSSDSRYWPFRVELTESFARPDRPKSPLPKGLRGVLIRAEENRLIVDFGRFGLYPIDQEITDFQNRLRQIQSGEREKSDPNYVNMIGPRLIESGEYAPVKFPVTRTRSARAFLFIYAKDKESLKSLASEISSTTKGLEDIVTILIPQFPYTDLEINALLNQHDLPCKAFLDFLCQPYIHSLHHSPDGRNLAVLTDMEGKILQKANGLKVMSILDALKPAG
jgi:hypothetical protein